ncbi:hypothetical protein HPB47_014546 [Ixodes persulcatus]|uniref:Uncharacterized protein n=1 Tax=Ixodes persulcatus TaxID=34615 RepID=A0AC60QZC7_IXOPE|nr:hypothetical protein HPB47_014546 [Ixodes persulcatus]
MRKFPADEKLHAVWTRLARPSCPTWVPAPDDRLCSDHFRDDDYERSPRALKSFGLPTKSIRLKPGVVPSIFSKKRKANPLSEPLEKPRKVVTTRSASPSSVVDYGASTTTQGSPKTPTGQPQDPHSDPGCIDQLVLRFCCVSNHLGTNRQPQHAHSNPKGHMCRYTYSALGIQAVQEKVCNDTENRLAEKCRIFFTIQKASLLPAIEKVWNKHQLGLFTAAAGKKLTIAGDGRADSPGHSAKYGTYTMFHVDSNKVLQVETAQSNETDGSYHMELEGLKRSSTFEAHRLVVVSL